MQVIVLNGHFATGKTYISNVLARVLEHSAQISGDRFDEMAVNVGRGEEKGRKGWLC